MASIATRGRKYAGLANVFSIDKPQATNAEAIATLAQTDSIASLTS
jgi:hypothetical protein